MLAARSLTFCYDEADRPALTDVDLDVPAGTITAVVGPGGAGRTTLARSLAGIDQPGTSTGRVTRPDRVGLVGTNPPLQRSGVAPDVATEIAFGLQYAGVTRAEQHRRVAEVAGALGLGHLLDRSPDRLSGGEQQRVALASILVLRPDAVLLDDADALLDPAGRAALVALLAQIAGSGTAVLTLGGRPEDTVAHATHATLLVAGRVAASGAPAAVLGSELARRTGVRQPAALRIPTDLGTVVLPPADAPPTVSLDAVAVGRALCDVTLDVAAGTALGLAGPNGAGKTTLAQLLNGMVRPTVGTVRHDGRDVARTPIPDLSRTVGHVFADPDQQLFARTVRAEVAFGPRAFGCADVAARVESCLAAVGLTDAADRHPYELSFAERKLLGLAATLAAGPSVVVLDEPTATLDQTQTDRVGAILATLRTEGRTVVLISHDVDLLHTHTDRLVVLDHGQVHRDGPTADILADPATLIDLPAARRVR